MTPRLKGVYIIVLSILIAAGLGLSLGAVPIPLHAVFDWIIGGPIDDQWALILNDVRLPRLIVGALCGAALAISGGVMQIWTANPLAGPGLLGLNGGASSALALTVAFWPWLGPGPLILISILGATSGGLLVLAILSVVPASDHPLRLILVGAMVSALLSSITATLVMANGMQADLLFWMVGGLGVVGWREAIYMAIALFIGTLLIFAIINELATASLGSSVARSLGVRPLRLRITLSVLVVVLAGTTNAIAGPLGFIGFLSPHLARRFTGPAPHRLLPFCAIVGAIFVVCADAIGRVVTPPNEQPLGIFVALIGAPALIAVALHPSINASSST